jgi:histidine triad (HIT) family protein
MTKYDFYCEEVLSWKINVNKLYEDKEVLAYYHTNPFWEKQIVINPKKHIKSLRDLEDDDLYIISKIIKVARDLSKNLNMKNWVKLLTNMWKFQDTPHLHFHLSEWKELFS